ncbi:MAG TPA: hypothetical protein VK731_03445 [Candidatus Cybelea sp.]|jgi:hypothetical protein|nr:hypothetical protein [Candidatus Cybelea sp.]
MQDDLAGCSLMLFVAWSADGLNPQPVAGLTRQLAEQNPRFLFLSAEK